MIARLATLGLVIAAGSLFACDRKREKPERDIDAYLKDMEAKSHAGRQDVWKADSTFTQACERQPILEVTRKFPTTWAYPKEFTPVNPEALPRPIEGFSEIPDSEYWLLSPLEEDCRHFWNLLVTAIPQSATFSKRADSREPIRILDIGCGVAADAIALHSYFGKSSYRIPGRNVSYLGIDYYDGPIKTAKRFHMERPELQFIQADAQRFDDNESLKGKFDVIVIRHPEIGSVDTFPVWKKIIEEAAGHLSQDGILLVTTYTCKEYLKVKEVVDGLGMKTEVSARNSFSGYNRLLSQWRPMQGPTSVEMSRRDRYVGIFSLPSRNESSE